MNAFENKQKENDNLSISAEVAQGKRSVSGASQLTDNRSQASLQSKVQALADGSPFTRAAAQFKAVMDVHASGQPNPIQKKENKTGLPDQLKSGIESLSGMSMDHVKVHYNSAQPTQLNAHAYAQGSDIHVAPGQEQHLPHEAWHVVQQAQGRVKPTLQMKSGMPVNDNAGLEAEADAMGRAAISGVRSDSRLLTVPGADRGSIQLYAYGAGRENRTVEVKGVNGKDSFTECLFNSVEYSKGDVAGTGSLTKSPADWGTWVRNNNEKANNATQMHVVNRRWGGIGTIDGMNITPGTPAENSDHSHAIESIFDTRCFGISKASPGESKAIANAKYACRFKPSYPNNVDVTKGDKTYSDPSIEAVITVDGKSEDFKCPSQGELRFMQNGTPKGK